MDLLKISCKVHDGQWGKISVLLDFMFHEILKYLYHVSPDLYVARGIRTDFYNMQEKGRFSKINQIFTRFFIMKWSLRKPVQTLLINNFLICSKYIVKLSLATIFGKLISPVTKIPEGVILGFQNLAWAPNSHKYQDSNP